MTAKVTYNGELRTTCLHLKSNYQIFTDAPTDNQGKGDAFSPTDLVATALASCMLTIMGIKSNNLDVDLTGTIAKVEKIMTSNPRRIERVNIVINFPRNDWDESVQKSLKFAALNCPVAKSLHTELVQNVKFEF